ncbi:MAG: hypothetical protein NT069_00655, partial [Planctomycetota bacterium]|nr:hypothetical protein [Planctomycetota bacterium]
MYTMATGRPAFRAESTYGILRRITDDAPRPIRELNPQIPDWLERLIGRLLEKSRDARFASAEEMGQLLEQCLAHVQQPMTVPLPAAVAAPVEPQVTVSDHAQWRHTGKMIAAFIAVATVALVWFAFFRSPHTPWVAPDMVNLGVDLPDRNEPISESKRSQVEDSGDSSSAPPALSTDGETDWNSVPRDLNALFDEAQSFEDRVTRFWNDEPETEQTNSPLDPPDQADPPLEQEITP